MAKVKLGDVVERIKEFVDKDNTHLEFYIGGEHFDEDEIKITKYGLIKGSTIGPAFHMKFMPDDVLLMSRNPHLRKAGVVDFEGICSDVSYILRTKDEKILLQSFLPYILQSNRFWNFAESNKKGSTNFFLNWSDFAKYEFDLPTIERQKELVTLLDDFTELRYAYKQYIKSADDLLQAKFVELFGNPIINTKKFETKKLIEVCPFNNYKGDVETINGNVWILNLDMIESQTCKLLGKVYDVESNIGASTLKFDENCVLYSKLRPYLNKVIIPDSSGYCTTELVYMNTESEKINKYFLCELLRSVYFVEYINSKTAGAKMPRASMEILKNFNLILPDISLQEEFEVFYLAIKDAQSNTEKALLDLTVLYKSVLNNNL